MISLSKIDSRLYSFFKKFNFFRLFDFDLLINLSLDNILDALASLLSLILSNFFALLLTKLIFFPFSFKVRKPTGNCWRMFNHDFSYYNASTSLIM